MNPVALRRLALAAALVSSVAVSGCSSKCGPSNCVGCCSAAGICEAASNNTCGVDGAVCTSCLSSEACVNGACGLSFGSSLGANGSTGSPTIAASSGSSGQSSGNSSGTGTPGASSGNASSGTHGSTSGVVTTSGSSNGATTGVTTGVTDIGTSNGTSTGATVGTSTGATVGTSTGATTGTSGVAIGTTTEATASSSGTAGTTTTTGSSTGSSGLPLCFSCTTLAQCASGYCNTNTGFCDTAMNCASVGQSCGAYTCGTDGHCECPATNSASTGTSGSTGSITEQGAPTCVSNAPVLPLNQPVTGETEGSDGIYVALGDQDPLLPDGGDSDSCFPAATFPTGDCQGSDSVYVFTPPSSGDYILSAIPDSAFDVALVVFEGACQNPIRSCVASIDALGAGSEESGTISLTGGTPYYVVVTGFYQDGGTDGSDFGSYTLEMATPPTCVTSDLGLSGPGTSASVSGDTTSATQTYAGGCESFPTSSVFYSFTSNATAAFSATVSTTDTSFQPVLSLGTGCGTTYAEQTCSAAPTTSASLDIVSLPAGSYTLVVSGGSALSIFTGSVGPFTLDAQLTTPIPPPSNNTCSGAKALTLSAQPDGGASTTLTVSNVGALNTNIGSAGGACAGSGRGGSIVYSLDLISPVAGLTATLTPGPDGGLNNPEISIQESPCYENTDAGTIPSELACEDSDGTPVSVSTTSLQAGTYYIWVGELDTGAPGVGTLQVSVP